MLDVGNEQKSNFEISEKINNLLLKNCVKYSKICLIQLQNFENIFTSIMII